MKKIAKLQTKAIVNFDADDVSRIVSVKQIGSSAKNTKEKFKKFRKKNRNIKTLYQ